MADERRWFHGTSGTYSFKPGDLLTPGSTPRGMSHVYYTSHLPSAAGYATWGHPLGEHGLQDLDADARPGHVYEVVPETSNGKRIGRHAEDPASGLSGNAEAYRTKGRLRVLHEVDRETGEPIEHPDVMEHFGAAEEPDWTYDNSIMGRTRARSPEGKDYTFYGSGTGIKSVRHHEDVPVPMYHGSDHEFAPGDLIETGHPGNFVSRMKHVYMTEQAEGEDGGYKGARGYGRHVYQVEPTGWYGHRKDARGGEWATEHPLRVVGEVPDPRERTAALEPGEHGLTWDEIGERHPGLYGDPEVHGEEADGSDGPGIGEAASHLAFSRPEDPDAEGHSVHDLTFHQRTVDPARIDYQRNERFDPRVQRAREGFRGQLPGEHVPPLVLVHRHGVFQVADGHHRAEGADLEHRPVRAYVAYSPHEHEPFGDGERGPYHGAETEERPPLADAMSGRTTRLAYEGWPHTAEVPAPRMAALVAYFAEENEPDAVAPEPRCRYCDEPMDDPEDIYNGSHDECDEMRWCEACQEHHEDPRVTEDHNSTYTDWGGHVFDDGIHRGVTVRLPDDVHAIVHDSSRPPEERAGALASYLHANPVDEDSSHGRAAGYGLHWTDHLPTAQAWGSGEGAMFGINDNERRDPRWTHVVMHAATPDDDDFETDPEELSRRNMLGYDHARSEREIPLTAAAPVHLTALSWKPAGSPADGWERHGLPPEHHAATASLVEHFDEDEDGVAPPWNGEKLFHGTRSILHPGEALTAGEAYRHRNSTDPSEEPYVFATSRGEEAHDWGERADSATADRRMRELGRQREVDRGRGENQDHAYPSRVYEVEPTGHVESDPWGEGHAYRSTSPMRVVREVHPLSCYHPDHEGEEHWPDHPHYEFLEHEQDQDDEDEDDEWGEHDASLDDEEGDEHDGDGYTTCDQGHEHWGLNGAAGLLIRHQGDDGQTRYLLQHRSPHVQHGGTWSTPGGAMGSSETPEHAALREATEEMGALPGDLTHHHTHTDDHGGWSYSTVVMNSPRMFTPGGNGETNWESSGHGWFTPDEIRELPLHPGFAATWGQVRRSGALDAGTGLAGLSPSYSSHTASGIRQETRYGAAMSPDVIPLPAPSSAADHLRSHGRTGETPDSAHRSMHIGARSAQGIGPGPVQSGLGASAGPSLGSLLASSLPASLHTPDSGQSGTHTRSRPVSALSSGAGTDRSGESGRTPRTSSSARNDSTWSSHTAVTATIWYHGTSTPLHPGDHIRPGMEIGSTSPYSALGSPGEIDAHTHATSDLGNAADYAQAHAVRSGGQPRVYAVTPAGGVEDDPGDNQSIRSRGRMRIEHEVPEHEWRPAHDEYLDSVTESRAELAREEVARTTSHTGKLVVAANVADRAPARVIAPALPAGVTARNTLGDWMPQNAAETHDMLDGFPVLFTAIYDGLMGVVAKLEDSPVSGEITGIVRTMATACQTAAEDATEIAARPLDGPEGMWEGSLAGKA